MEAYDVDPHGLAPLVEVAMDSREREAAALVCDARQREREIFDAPRAWSEHREGVGASRLTRREMGGRWRMATRGEWWSLAGRRAAERERSFNFFFLF